MASDTAVDNISNDVNSRINSDAHNRRSFTSVANSRAKKHLQGLLDNKSNPEIYRKHMRSLGEMLAQTVISTGLIQPNIKRDDSNTTLIISTAEDADFLQMGVSSELNLHNVNTKLAIFWNNHYQIADNSSVAPILHKFVQSGYESAKNIIVVNSIISGSCVVRTNLIELIDNVSDVENIVILSPVRHEDSEAKLIAEFPASISDKFRFISFAIDEQRTNSGMVIPGIGGQVYERLGLGKQAVFTGYIPKIVQSLSLSTNSFPLPPLSASVA